MKKLLAVLLMLPVLLAPLDSASARGGRGGGGRGGRGSRGRRPDHKKKDKQKALLRNQAENRAALLRDARADHE